MVHCQETKYLFFFFFFNLAEIFWKWHERVYRINLSSFFKEAIVSLLDFIAFIFKSDNTNESSKLKIRVA